MAEITMNKTEIAETSTPSARRLTLNLSERLYEHLYSQAQATARTVNEVVEERLIRSIPPLEDDLPPAIRAELVAMERLSDHALWQIAESKTDADTTALYDVLLARLHHGTLTPAGRDWLRRLRSESEALTLRKAHAYLVLKNRGYQLPTLEALATPRK